MSCILEVKVENKTPPHFSVATPTRHDRVVRREICNIVTKGTRTLRFSEGVESESESAFLLAIKEVTTPSFCGHAHLTTPI